MTGGKPREYRVLTDPERQTVADYYEYAVQMGWLHDRATAARPLSDESLGVVHFALIEAVQRHKPDSGFKLATFIRCVVWRRLDTEYTSRTSRSSRRTVPIRDDECGGEFARTDPPNPAVEIDAFEHAIGPCSSHHKTLLRAVYLDGETQRAAGNRIGVGDAQASVFHSESIALLKRRLSP